MALTLLYHECSQRAAAKILGVHLTTLNLATTYGDLPLGASGLPRWPHRQSKGMADAKTVADDPRAHNAENSTWHENHGRASWNQKLATAWRAVLHGALRVNEGSLEDISAEVHAWLGAPCPATVPGPPVATYKDEKERRANVCTLWAAVVSTVINDAEVDAISADANGRPMLKWWCLS
jgi:hypothetical protein